MLVPRLHSYSQRPSSDTNDDYARFARLRNKYWGRGEDQDVMNTLFTTPDGPFPEDCSILNLQEDVDDIFPAEPPYKILVRRDYEELKTMIQLKSNRSARIDRGTASGIVVTGQPGIGVELFG
jgi:hypothetical protein